MGSNEHMNILLPIILSTMMYYGSVQHGHSNWGMIGIEYSPGDHKIVKVWSHSPAAKAGLHPGDVVIHINDKNIDGPPFTSVNLTIRRKTDIFTVVLERVPHNEIDWKKEAK
jgi:C-terminal processing protease CtpA/Prc